MLCPKCRKRVPDNSTFCSGCGQPLGRNRTPGTRPGPSSRSGPNSRPGPNRRPAPQTKTGLILIPALCVVAVLAFLVASFGNGHSSSRSSGGSQAGSAAGNRPSSSGRSSSSGGSTGSGSSSGGNSAPSGVILPSAQSFSGYKMNAHDEGSTQPWYLAHINEAFVEEYVELVQNYGFTLRDSRISSNGSRYYVFDYSGPEQVGTFNVDRYQFTHKDVSLYIYAIVARNMEVHVRFGSGVTYWETSDRTTETVSAPEQSSGGGGGGGGDQDCWHCGGSGTCPTCGGSGKVMNWLPGTREYVEQECTDCYRSGVCRDCNGSGNR